MVDLRFAADESNPDSIRVYVMREGHLQMHLATVEHDSNYRAPVTNMTRWLIHGLVDDGRSLETTTMKRALGTVVAAGMKETSST